jgi:hypothetical protein
MECPDQIPLWAWSIIAGPFLSPNLFVDAADRYDAKAGIRKILNTRRNRPGVYRVGRFLTARLGLTQGLVESSKWILCPRR